MIGDKSKADLEAELHNDIKVLKHIGYDMRHYITVYKELKEEYLPKEDSDT